MILVIALLLFLSSVFLGFLVQEMKRVVLLDRLLSFFSSIFFFGFLVPKLKRAIVQVPPLPPGPRPWPIIGCLPEMRRNGLAYRWIHDLMKQLNTDIICVRLGHAHVVAVTSPEIAREFLKKHDAVFASRPITMATNIFSNGFLATVDTPMGEHWKKMKTILSAQISNHSRLRWLLGKRNDEADNLVKLIYSQCSINKNGSVVNVRNAAQHYAANVMRMMIFNMRYFGNGREDGGPGLQEERHVSALFTTLLYLNSFCVSDFLPWLRPFDIDGHEKKLRYALKVIKQYQDPIIDERIRKWRCSNKENKIEDHVQEDLLDVFILLKGAHGQPLLSAEEIKAQITDLQLAAVDNPSNAAEWALSEMLNQPEMLTKAQDELNKVVGTHMLVQESHIPHLPYITACARESLRLHPIAPFNLPHVSTADAIVAGYFIPKGSSVLLSRLGLGRNPKVWKNPLKFDPERHLNGDVNQQVSLGEHELRFISFSTGRRHCPGGTLGTTMTIMFLARLLQGFTWSIPPNVEENIDLSADPYSFLKLTPLHAHAEPRLPHAVYPV